MLRDRGGQAWTVADSGGHEFLGSACTSPSGPFRGEAVAASNGRRTGVGMHAAAARTPMSATSPSGQAASAGHAFRICMAVVWQRRAIGDVTVVARFGMLASSRESL
jgi:hypothetical protein